MVHALLACVTAPIFSALSSCRLGDPFLHQASDATLNESNSKLPTSKADPSLTIRVQDIAPRPLLAIGRR